MSGIYNTTIKHEIDSEKEKKAFIKNADKDFKVKVVFGVGVNDDTASVLGFKNDVKSFSVWFKTYGTVAEKPKTLTRRFAGLTNES